MRATEFITEGSNTSLENALNKMEYGYLHGRTKERNTCYAYVGQELARIKPDDATIRFWGRKPDMIVHGDAILPNGKIISSISPDKYEQYGYELVDEMPLRAAKFITEMPLPNDWEPEKLSLRQTFKNRLAYALERAKRLGSGSSRVAMTINYEDRPTVLKVAKNAKGLAQNEAEINILNDGYLGQLPIVIPLVDYDRANNRPVWIQTELAKKVNMKRLCELLHLPPHDIWTLQALVSYRTGKDKSPLAVPVDKLKEQFLKQNKTEKDWEIVNIYADEVAELIDSSTLESGDLANAANWGEYNNRPVIIDLGFTGETKHLYGFK
jgi:hypothetical protein